MREVSALKHEASGVPTREARARAFSSRAKSTWAVRVERGRTVRVRSIHKWTVGKRTLSWGQPCEVFERGVCAKGVRCGACGSLGRRASSPSPCAPESVDERQHEPVGRLVRVGRGSINVLQQVFMDTAARHTVRTMRPETYYSLGTAVYASIPVEATGVAASPGPRGIFFRRFMLTLSPCHPAGSVPWYQSHGICSMTQAKWACGPGQELNREVFRSGSILQTRSALEACHRAGTEIYVDEIVCLGDRTEADLLVKIILVPLLRCGECPPCAVESVLKLAQRSSFVLHQGFPVLHTGISVLR